MNSSTPRPVGRKFESAFSLVEIENLKSSLTDLIICASKTFKESPDTLEWSLLSEHGKLGGKITLTDPPDVSEIFALLNKQSDYVSVQVHKTKKTSRGFPLFPEEYFLFVIDFDNKKVGFETHIASGKDASELLHIALRGFKLIMAALPTEHQYLEAYLREFHQDHPEYEKNVFIIMRFQDQAPFPNIVQAIRDECAKHGLRAIRADDKEYTDDLWDNVMTYLYGCASAIAVFDQVNYREFNPNVAMEVGFLSAQCKKVLLLKDTSIPVLPTDIVGKIYRTFNTYEPLKTIPPQLEKWITNYKIGQ